MSNLMDVLSTGLAQIEERFVRLEINIAANAALTSANLKRSKNHEEILADAEAFLQAGYSDAPEPFLELVRARMRRLFNPRAEEGSSAGDA